MGQTSKYTPGPWEVDDDQIFGGKATEGQYEGWKLICQIPTECNPGEVLTEEDKANIQLIAAAPEMLQALHDIDTWLIAPRTDRETLNHFRYLVQTAIRKAEGTK